MIHSLSQQHFRDEFGLAGATGSPVLLAGRGCFPIRALQCADALR